MYDGIYERFYVDKITVYKNHIGDETLYNSTPPKLYYPIDNDISKRIISIRFLLSVFVVFIHNVVQEIHFAGGTEVYTIPSYVHIIREMLSNIVASVAVPLFFLISGFLLYAKDTDFLVVLKKKSRTILLPYLLWNILMILFYFIGQNLTITKPYFATIIISKFGFSDWLGAFTGKFGMFAGGYPFLYPLWFLRDLFILNLFFIGIKKLIDIFPLGTFLLFFTLWVSSVNIYVVSPEALLFFSLGYYIVKYHVDYRLIDKIKAYDVCIFYIIAVIFELFFTEYFPIIHKINILTGCVIFLKLTNYFIKNNNLYHKLAWLESYAFFVYVFHAVPLAVMNKLYVKILPMDGAWLLVQYFSVPLLGIVFFVMVGYLFKKLFPRIYAVMTGGRI